MSKQTGNVAFRRLDVDAIGDEVYHDDEEDAPETPGLGPDDNEVQSLLNGGRNLEALKAALKNAPLRTKHQPTKDRATQLVMRVLCATKAVDIDKIIQSLDRDQLDLLMKYVYKGFEFPSEGSSAQLLTWHEKLFNVGGLGCIVRVLTDRKRL